MRCVRYAFGNIHTRVGRVFFSKRVALPFLRWRMLRHGYFKYPVHWREHAAGEVSPDILGTRHRLLIFTCSGQDEV